MFALGKSGLLYCLMEGAHKRRDAFLFTLVQARLTVPLFPYQAPPKPATVASCHLFQVKPSPYLSSAMCMLEYVQVGDSPSQKPTLSCPVAGPQSKPSACLIVVQLLVLLNLVLMLSEPFPQHEEHLD